MKTKTPKMPTALRDAGFLWGPGGFAVGTFKLMDGSVVEMRVESAKFKLVDTTRKMFSMVAQSGYEAGRQLATSQYADNNRAQINARASLESEKRALENKLAAIARLACDRDHDEYGDD